MGNDAHDFSQIIYIADKEGFEPTVAINYVSFQNWCHKPLDHLSGMLRGINEAFKLPELIDKHTSLYRGKNYV